MTTLPNDKFHWTRRVARHDIQRLFESDAAGLLDVDLLDQVFYAFHARISDMLEVMDAQTYGRVHCRGCGAILAQPYRMGSRAKGLSLACEQCGWQVTCGEFYNSYTGERMLPGAARLTFLGFMQKAPAEKLLVIDWLIHEFHVNQGIAGRPVGENVIQGTAVQVAELILKLASGPSATSGRAESAEWNKIFNDPIRQWRQKHAYAVVLQIAAELGIRNRRQMEELELVQEIYHRAPQLFD
jgi:hypothetical protein